MKDTWSWMNECVQNILALAVVFVYLLMVFRGADIPWVLHGAFSAVLFFFGFRTWKQDGKNGKV